MTVSEVLAAQGGVVRWSELRDAGATRAAVDRWVRHGDLVRVDRGLLALPTADPVVVDLRQRGGRIACVTLAHQMGLWKWRDPSMPHVGVSRGLRLPDCVVHRTSGDYELADALLSCCRCLPEIEALVLIESAVVLGRVSLPGLRRRFAGARPSWASRVLDQVHPESGSMIETLARCLLRRAGFTVQCQVRIDGVGHLDLMVEGTVGVEVDGAQFHSDRRAYREDRRRWNLLTRQGVPVLRVTYEMVVHDPEAFVSLVRQTLDRHTRR
ncbi:hypothetical protein BKD30_12775 [Tersicoccus phoenicis]|uniref:DUF559 domain-containing protein n=1 Tax=Tersicoccus phoenicis TaxID=554083 RepID=A0A1R1L763_9MICC|nr:type IV toxin-antitoxin system AbiEi family antitoxin domain-containing protein [Tersicoccus phoenicis]OMH23385.1 hypothetical protein BKD30_12775 [Tersicoccus phoenicis]